MASIALTGVNLHVEVHGPAGDVPVVVLLHGLGSSSSDWALQIPVFAERCRVLAVDLRGHGRSRPASGRLSVAAFAADVSRALGALGERSVHVVGLSLGGCVALALALGDPSVVRSLTLVNAFARLRPAGLRGGLRMIERLALLCVAPMPVVAAHVARGLFPKPEQREAYLAAVASLGENPRRTYFASIRALGAFDVTRKLGAIRCPALIVAGDRDRTVPRSSAHLLHRAIPGARLLVVPDSGHATPYDQPDLFNRAVLDFIAVAGFRNFSEGGMV